MKQIPLFFPRSREKPFTDRKVFYGALPWKNQTGLDIAKNDFASTQSPAWGVTKAFQADFGITAISTHTPAWGVTALASASSFFIRFQLTSPRGG